MIHTSTATAPHIITTTTTNVDATVVATVSATPIDAFIFQSSFVGAIAIGDLIKSTLGPKGMVSVVVSGVAGSVVNPFCPRHHFIVICPSTDRWM